MATETRVNREQSSLAMVPPAGAERQTPACERNKAKLVADLKMAMADAESLIKEAAGSSAETFATLRERFEMKLGEMRAKVDRTRTTVGEKAKYATDATHAYMKKNPWKFAGAVAVAGMILGALLRRR